MDKAMAQPRLTSEGVYFKVAAGDLQRECLVSKNALAYLCRSQGQPAAVVNAMHVYRSCESRIQAVARRLVAAGESASPLILGAAYFVESGGSRGR